MIPRPLLCTPRANRAPIHPMASPSPAPEMERGGDGVGTLTEMTHRTPKILCRAQSWPSLPLDPKYSLRPGELPFRRPQKGSH